MNTSKIRKIFLWSFLGFLSLTALIAVFSVLSHEFGETQVKVLATTFTISAASICAMSCAAFIQKRGLRAAGLTGMILAAIAAGLTITCIWAELGEEGYWKTAGTLIVISVAFTHALLLWIPTLPARQLWTQFLAMLFIIILVALILIAVWGKVDQEDYYRGLAVVSIFVVLMTLVVPICSKLGGQPAGEFDRLVLQKISDGIYTDQSGRRLQVTEIGAERAP